MFPLYEKLLNIIRVLSSVLILPHKATQSDGKMGKSRYFWLKQPFTQYYSFDPAIHSSNVFHGHLPFTVGHLFAAPLCLHRFCFLILQTSRSSLGTPFLPKQFGSATNVLIWSTTEYQRANVARIFVLQERKERGGGSARQRFL